MFGCRERRDLLHILQEPEALTDADIAAVRDTIARHDGYARTGLVARRYVALAQEALCVLPPSLSRDSLRDLADYAVTRER